MPGLCTGIWTPEPLLWNINFLSLSSSSVSITFHVVELKKKNEAWRRCKTRQMQQTLTCRPVSNAQNKGNQRSPDYTQEGCLLGVLSEVMFEQVRLGMSSFSKKTLTRTLELPHVGLKPGWCAQLVGCQRAP